MDSKLLDNTYDRISAIAQCRDADTIMEIVDQIAHSVGARSHALLHLAQSANGANGLVPPWNRSPLADVYARGGFGRAVGRTLARLRRPVTHDTMTGEEAHETDSIARDLREAGIENFLAVPVFRNSTVAAAFCLNFASEMPEEAGWVAGLVAPLLYEQTGELAAAPTNGSRERPPNPLTPRELECLIWSADGKTSWEISEILNVSERTVNAHLGRAIRKLGVVSRTQAVADAIRRGLIQ